MFWSEAGLGRPKTAQTMACNMHDRRHGAAGWIPFSKLCDDTHLLHRHVPWHASFCPDKPCPALEAIRAFEQARDYQQSRHELEITTLLGEQIRPGPCASLMRVFIGMPAGSQSSDGF